MFEIEIQTDSADEQLFIDASRFIKIAAENNASWKQRINEVEHKVAEKVLTRKDQANKLRNILSKSNAGVFIYKIVKITTYHIFVTLFETTNADEFVKKLCN